MVCRYRRKIKKQVKEGRDTGLFEKIFNKDESDNKRRVNGYFTMLNAYSPVFTTYEGGVYEMELTRASIHAFALHASKLLPEVNGSALPGLDTILSHRPNPFMSTSQFVYRVATILSVNNTAMIVPIEDEFGRVTGYYPILPDLCEVIDVGGEPYLRYTFYDGKRAAIEYSKVGVLTNYQYKNDFFGENNHALDPTMQLISTQNQGIIEGVKNSASIRFMGKLSNFMKPKDIKEKRKQLVEENFGPDNTNGFFLYDNTMTDVKQIVSKPFTVDSAQMNSIEENVFNYFGVNTAILQNSFDEDGWNAFYEGKLEPFAIQLSLAMSNMTYSMRELARGNSILWTSNRLQYASNSTKLQVSTQLFDRGLITRNQVMDIWNYAHVPDGDKYYLRKEYAEVGEDVPQKEQEGDENAAESDA